MVFVDVYHVDLSMICQALRMTKKLQFTNSYDKYGKCQLCQILAERSCGDKESDRETGGQEILITQDCGNVVNEVVWYIQGIYVWPSCSLVPCQRSYLVSPRQIPGIYWYGGYGACSRSSATSHHPQSDKLYSSMRSTHIFALKMVISLFFATRKQYHYLNC